MSEEKLPTAAHIVFIEDENPGNIAYKRAQTREPEEHGDWQSDELVRRSDHQQFRVDLRDRLIDICCKVEGEPAKMLNEIIEELKSSVEKKDGDGGE